MSTSPDAVVRNMCAAWSTRDADSIAEHFHDDAVYHNIPMDPVRGRAAIRAFIAGFVALPEEAEFEILHQMADGPVVLNERVDRFRRNGREIALPVAGVFEVHDGLITAWRDYYDPAHAAALAE